MSEHKKESEPQISVEELARRKKEMTKFYNEQIEFLKVQIKYEGLITEIEELKTRRITAVVRRLQMTAPHEAEPEETAPEAPEKTETAQPKEEAPKDPIIRKLKVETTEK